MNVKVYLNNLKLDLSKDFDRAKDYFHRHGVELNFTFKQSNVKGYKVINQKFAAGNRLEIDGHQKKLILNPEEITIFAFSGDEFPLEIIPTSKCEYSEQGILITFMSYKGGAQTGENYLTLIHELMHAVLRKLGVQDPIDIWYVNGVPRYYFHNDQPEASDSNFGEAWRRIGLVLNPPQTQVTLTRGKSLTKETLGFLAVENGDRSFRCHTLELPWNDNRPNISCIPTGIYKVKYTFSFKFLKYTYEVQNVLGRSGIRLHSANYFFDLMGCIALGNGLSDINKDGSMDVLNSRMTVLAFEDFLERKDFTLEIK